MDNSDVFFDSGRRGVPEGMERPDSIGEMLRVCRCIFDSTRQEYVVEEDGDNVWIYPREKEVDLIDTSTSAVDLVPEQYKDLARWLEQMYERQYELGQGITFEDPFVEAMFQQLQIVLDQERGRVNVNWVGLYAPSYIDALGSAIYSYQEPYIYDGEVTGSFSRSVDNRYLGIFDYFTEEKSFSAILLGCSSLSSAEAFRSMVKGMNAEATPIIIDHDPMAVALAESLGIDTVMADVCTTDFQLPLADLVATNFLLSSMPQETRMEAYRKLFSNWRERIHPRTGRLVLVEQMNEADARAICDLASECGYVLSGDDNPRTKWGRNRSALRYTSSKSVDENLVYLIETFKREDIYVGNYYSDRVDVEVVPEARCLIFVPEIEGQSFIGDGQYYR